MADNFYEKKYLRDQSKNRLYVIITVFGIAGIAVTFFSYVNVPAAGGLAVIGILMLATKDKPVLQFDKTYFEYKPSLLGSVILVKYKDVQSVENKGKSIDVHVNGRKKTVRILLTFFDISMRSEIADHVEKLTALSVSESKSQ